MGLARDKITRDRMVLKPPCSNRVGKADGFFMTKNNQNDRPLMKSRKIDCPMIHRTAEKK